MSESVADGGERWCRECGLKLAADMPMMVHTGHVHKPIPAHELDDARTVWAVAKASGDEAAQNHVASFLARAGITEQAVDMFNRLNLAVADGSEGTGELHTWSIPCFPENGPPTTVEVCRADEARSEATTLRSQLEAAERALAQNENEPFDYARHRVPELLAVSRAAEKRAEEVEAERDKLREQNIRNAFDWTARGKALQAREARLREALEVIRDADLHERQMRDEAAEALGENP